MQKQFNPMALSRLLLQSKWMMLKESRLAFIAEINALEQQGNIELPSYQEETKSILAELTPKCNYQLTDQYSDSGLEDDTIAYHRVYGTILADIPYRWYFSTKRFVDELLAADRNPSIIAHIIHINSGGGEAWYLDVAHQTVANLEKPVITLYEKYGCSAALYIGMAADKHYTLNQNDTIGSMGTMVDFWDIAGALEQCGYKHIQENAKKSDLKNKRYNDLKDGKSEEYIKKELDPLQQQFETALRQSIPFVNKLAEDDPLFRGDTFDAKHAIEKGLISGITTIPEVIAECYKLGKAHQQKENNKQNFLKLDF